MTKLILAALVTLAAGPAPAQSAAAPNNYVANPGIPFADTGPRYCPELAGTDHPFRPVCPSLRDAFPVNGISIGHNPGQAAEVATHGTPVEQEDQN